MPQLEDGYTRIANEILEKVAKTKLNGTQYRILLIVWRSTYGWQEKEHELSLKYLSNATGIHKQQIKKAVDELLEKGILSEEKSPTYTSPRVRSFNKNYLQYTKTVTVSQLGDTTVSQLGDTTVSQLGDQKRNINKYKEIYDYYMTLDLIKHRKYTKEMVKAIKHAESNLGIDAEEMKVMLKRHEEKVNATKNKGDYKTKPRGLAVFFGQKKANSTVLICSDYLDENYEEPKNKTEKVLKTEEMEIVYE